MSNHYVDFANGEKLIDKKQNKSINKVLCICVITKRRVF